MASIITIIGLIANLTGSIFLLIATRPKHAVYIPEYKCKEEDVPSEKEVKKLKNWYIVGLWFLVCGFLLQILGVIVKK